jgi:hypothetical protein
MSVVTFFMKLKAAQMKITKQQAAEANLDAAIDAFLRGDWVPSIHLAGAAEEVFSRLEEARGGKTTPDFLWGKTDFKDLVEKKKDYISALNYFRDWIKHHNTEHPNEVEILEPHVVISVMRAIHAQASFTNQGRRSVARFIHWYEENKGRIHKILESWPD